ncbi:hypothetical protein L484_010616 [Morus notabilis]|uniref:Uncharacterized protein n=1 Tax=Morus notabilis TaxID=981085 RepID=W9QL16_9ROSA|nr:hypothetical protein L484_010616 [Morus notabilis]
MEGQINVVWGFWSVVVMAVVAAVVMFAPLGMGPVQPPSTLAFLSVPLVLVVVYFILHRASK